MISITPKSCELMQQVDRRAIDADRFGREQRIAGSVVDLHAR